MIRAHTVACIITTLAIASPAMALVPVTLQNGTATFSQGGGFDPPDVHDGNLGGTSVVNGWALGNERTYHQLVVETATDVPAGRVQFTMTQNFGQQLLLGRFRFSITDNDRSEFAPPGGGVGDVTTDWDVLTSANLVSVALPAGMTYTINGDGGFADSILTAGTIPVAGVYTITYDAPYGGITGFRLEAITHATLPSGLGPGWEPGSGNFVLQELAVQAPEPAAAGIMLLASVLALRRRR
jgi:hypothetical protein